MFFVVVTKPNVETNAITSSLPQTPPSAPTAVFKNIPPSSQNLQLSAEQSQLSLPSPSTMPSPTPSALHSASASASASASVSDYVSAPALASHSASSTAVALRRIASPSTSLLRLITNLEAGTLRNSQ